MAENTVTKKKVVFRIINTTKDKILEATDVVAGRLAVSTDTHEIFCGDGTQFVAINNQFATMPVPSKEFENVTVQYVGTNTVFYVNGVFYTCVQNDGAYIWQVKSNIPIITSYVPDEGIANLGLCVKWNGSTTVRKGVQWITGHRYQCVYKNGAYTYEDLDPNSPPTGTQFAGTTTTVPTSADGKVRIYTDGSTLTAFSGAVTYEGKRRLRVKGCFRSNASGTTTTAKMGKLYWGKTLITQDYDTWIWGMCWQQNCATHAFGYRTNDGLTIYRGSSAFSAGSDLWCDITIATNFDLY